MSGAHGMDFIEVYPGALEEARCADYVDRLRASADLRPGRVGGGVFPELKRSHDLSLAGRADWADAELALNQAASTVPANSFPPARRRQAASASASD